MTVEENLRMGAFVASPRDEGAHPEVLLDGHLREDAPSLGHHADAELHDLVGAEPVDARALEPHGALGRPDDAEDGPDERGLARAVRPEQTRDPPRLDRERRSEEHTSELQSL